MRAGELRFRGEVEQYDGANWQLYFSDFFDFQTSVEGESERSYDAQCRWRPEWDQVSGLAVHSKGFRIVWTYGQKDGQALVRLLLIDSVRDPDNRRREVQILCHEVVE